MSLYEELVKEAAFYVGVSEQVGKPNAGPNIEEFQKAVDGKAVGEPWCLGFIAFILARVAERHGRPYPLHKTEHVLTLWNKTPKSKKRYLSSWQRMPGDIVVPRPEPGWLMVWQHAGTSSGHIGIVEWAEAGSVFTIEGNTGPDDKTVVREGDGVFRKARNPGGSGNMKVIGFIDPWSEQSEGQEPGGEA